MAGATWAPRSVLNDPAFVFLSTDTSFLDLTQPTASTIIRETSLHRRRCRVRHNRLLRVSLPHDVHFPRFDLALVGEAPFWSPVLLWAGGAQLEVLGLDNVDLKQPSFTCPIASRR